jgi:phage terminase large subunit-like protein
VGLWLRRLSREAQRPPRDEAWRTWVLLGGRGSGKTRAGAEWLQARADPGTRLALVGATLHDVREVMVGGESGLLAIAPEGCRPAFERGERRRRVRSACA